MEFLTRSSPMGERMNRSMDQIHIRTFGNFEISYQGKVYTLEKNQSTKTAHLIQFLMVNQGKPFEKDELVEILYKDGEVSDPLNNLKVNVFRLRQMIEKSGLPGEKHILHRKGCYSWNKDIPLSIDVDEFKLLLDHAARNDLPNEDRAALTAAAIELYGGEFLPGLRGEKWVSSIDADCRQRFLDAVSYVDGYCRETDNYELQDKILTHAVKLFPYDEKIRGMQLSSLIARKMYREAMSLYESVTTRMMNDIGIVPSEELTRLHQVLISELDVPIMSFSEIRADIANRDREAGACSCGYTAFIDTANLISHYAAKSGQSAFVAICTLLDAREEPLPAGNRLQDAAAAVNSAIKETLHRGNLYTRYGPSQFLVLVIGESREGMKALTEKIEENFHREPSSRGVYCRWEFEPIAAVDKGEIK